LPPSTRKIIRQHILPLIRALGIASTHLLDIIKDFPAGADGLVLRTIIILTEKSKLVIFKEIITIRKDV